MPFTLIVVAVALVGSLLRGGRLGRMAQADLRATWLLFFGLALQVGVELAAVRGHLGGDVGYALILISQLLVVAWTVVNWWRPGMALILLGLVLNATVMAANGAMPVAPEAIEAVGLDGAEVPPGKHELMDEDTRLPFLADTWPLPPIRTIVSIGDIVLAAGLIPLVHHLMTYRTPAERRGGSRS